MEKLTDAVLLSGAGARSFCGDISNADLESLENGGWVTDGIISLIFGNIQQYVNGNMSRLFGNIQQYVNGNKLALVKWSITQMLRKSPDSCVVTKTVDFKLKEKD